jgi:hypothetical protein
LDHISTSLCSLFVAKWNSSILALYFLLKTNYILLITLYVKLEHILCCVFAKFFFVLYVASFSGLPIWYSLTFIQTSPPIKGGQFTTQSYIWSVEVVGVLRGIFCYYWQTFMIVSCIECTLPRARNWSWWQGWGRGTSYINVYTDMPLEWFDFFSFQIYDWVVNCPPLWRKCVGSRKRIYIYISSMIHNFICFHSSLTYKVIKSM